MSKKVSLPQSRLIAYSLWIYREVPNLLEAITNKPAGLLWEFLKEKKFVEEHQLAEYCSSFVRELREGEGDNVKEFLDFVSMYDGKTDIKSYKHLLNSVVFDNDKQKEIFVRYNIHPFIIKMFDLNAFDNTEIDGMFTAMSIKPLEPLDREDFIEYMLEDRI